MSDIRKNSLLFLDYDSNKQKFGRVIGPRKHQIVDKLSLLYLSTVLFFSINDGSQMAEMLKHALPGFPIQTEKKN